MLKIPCEQLVEGENKDPILRLFSISYTFRARCPLSRCGLAAIFEVADVNENSLALCLRLSPQSNICESWPMTLRKYCYQCQRDSGDKVSKILPPNPCSCLVVPKTIILTVHSITGLGSMTVVYSLVSIRRLLLQRKVVKNRTRAYRVN